MASLTIEVPDDPVRSLEGIAATQRKSVEQLALERSIPLVDAAAPGAGSPAAVLRVVRKRPT
jgi:hypothetical protein